MALLQSWSASFGQIDERLSSPTCSITTTHQDGATTPDRTTFPRIGSSEELPTIRSDMFDAKFWESEDEAFDKAETTLKSDSVESSSTVDSKGDEGDWQEFDQTYSGNLRPHGVSLDTITEKSSVATIPLRKLPRYLPKESEAASRKVSAPVLLMHPDEDSASQWMSRSLDEAFMRPRRSISLNGISEASDSGLQPSIDLASPALPPVDTPVIRIKTPPGLPRWPADIPRQDKSPPRSRRTSAYVRDIYERLAGAPTELQAASPQNHSASLPSRIPVPRHLARGGRTGSGYWKPLPSGHTYGTSFDQRARDPHSCHSAKGNDRLSPLTNTPAPRQRTQPSPNDENTAPTKVVSKRVSGLLKRASRLFEPGRPLSNAPLSTINQESQAHDSSTQPLEEHPRIQNPSPGISQILEVTGQANEVSPTKSVATSKLTPEPLVVSGRSISNNANTVQTKQRSGDACLPGTPNKWKKLPETPQSVDAHSPASCQSSHGSRGSWALPLTPLLFPSPPSPNVYSTPPAYRSLRDDPGRDRFTRDGVPIEPSTASSVHEYDAATDRQGLDRIVSSNTDSSTSIVAGRSLYQSTPYATARNDDIFAELPILRVTYPSDDPFDDQAIDLPSLPGMPWTPIKVPSPLRPRFRPNPQYNLFPDTQSPKAKLPPFAPGMPIIRAIRSVSSRLRATNSPQPPPKTPSTTATTRLAPHSRAPKKGHHVFPRPLEKIQRRRSKSTNVQRQKARKDKRHELIRRTAIWVPTHCFCQPADDAESFRGPHARVARPVRMAERRDVVE